MNLASADRGAKVEFVRNPNHLLKERTMQYEAPKIETTRQVAAVLTYGGKRRRRSGGDNNLNFS